MSSLIQIKNLSKTFSPERKLFSGLSVQVTQGDFLCILGPSGCGKSTLLQIIAGLDRNFQGQLVSHFGQMGFMFQEPRLLPWLSVSENISLPLELASTPTPKLERQNIVLRSLTKAALGPEIANLFPWQLSGGMKSRVALARALVNAPELLLLDEPFAALDDLNRFRLQQELRALYEQNQQSLVMITHSIQEAVYLANRVLVLDHRGALKAELLISGPDSRIPRANSLDWRFSAEAGKLAQQLREALES